MARRERYMDACPKDRNCWGCFYAEECPVWNNQDAEPTQIPVTEVYMSLCEGRHEIPQAIDGSIFGTELDPLDLSGMEREATEQKIKVTLYHYNRETGKYYPQEVK